MTGKTHMAIGTAIGLTLSVGQPIESQLLLIAAAAFGSLVPDLDHPKSKLNQKLLLINNDSYRILFYLSIGAVLIYLDSTLGNKIFRLLGITMIMTGISSHRTFTHSLLGLFLFSSIVCIGTLEYGLEEALIGFVVGYSLHLIMDFFTPKGIQIFFPLKKNISAPITIKTNGFAEKVVFIGSNFYSMFLIFQQIK
ncbi:metal-dependent hydrolase [Tissierella sp. MSJ-40]|uniref:Metal-dependent hydrolase n=1 Tax=Tissierella simiarum TaxID=2841534 RepID=A0ABS6EAU2_9FIRM|nr:metal-dependent hydrolase [Tissierella simiarum]MBU5440054.1 metal-dependent hydrolase [Tissierella simiarum]